MTGIIIPTDELLPMFGENGELWTQGKWSDGDLLCMHEGIKRCAAKQPGDFHIIERVAAAEGWGTIWNDRDGRTWGEVKAKIFEVAEITPDRLEAVFGPQWQPIVALVRRAATLTEEEAKQLAAAWDAAWAAARAAARDAARAAARDAAWAAAWAAARDAARAAARDAASDAAWAAARAAARALVIRDLIGQHGFTQEHYDRLTGPWRIVVGPVHPDDVDIKGATDA